MKSLQLMLTVYGSEDLIVANAPLFSNKLTKWLVVKDITKQKIPDEWFIIAYKGLYTFRALEVIRSHIVNKSSKFRLLTTSATYEQIAEYMRHIFNSEEYYYSYDEDIDTRLKKLVGRELTDSTILLWLLETNYDGDLTDDNSIEEYVNMNHSEYSSYEDVIKKFIPSINSNQCVFVSEALKKLCGNTNCNINRNTFNAANVLSKSDVKPKQLLLWLLHAISIMECAERRYVICGKGWQIPTAI